MQSTKNTRTSIVLLPVVAGLGVCAAATFFFATKPDRSHSRPSAAAETPKLEDARPATRRASPAPRAQIDTSGVGTRLSELEKRMNEMAKGADPAQPAATPEPPSEEEREAHADEAQAAASARLHEKIDAFESEAPDPAWAGTTEATLETEMATLSSGARGEAVRSVQCKSTSCLATVSFPTYDAARAGFGRYAMGAYGEVRCAQTAVLDEPSDPAAPYEVHVLFDNCVRE